MAAKAFHTHPEAAVLPRRLRASVVDTERSSRCGRAAIYGGYFGAGLSVIVLSALGITMRDTLTRLNAIKQLIAFSANVAAAVFFLFSGQVVWMAALVMAAGALLGGNLGGRLAGRVQPSTLRWIVVSIGVIVSIIYFVRV